MLLTARSLTLRRGQRELLRGLDLELREGQRWAVIGPNGSGKSTLLSVLAGAALGPDDEGELRRLPGIWTAAVEQGAGLAASLPSEASLLDLAASAQRPLQEMGTELTRMAVALGPAPEAELLDRYGRLLALFEARGGYQMRERLSDALARIDLGSAAERPLALASEGERRRARLAGALASGAELLILDEPSNHLDIRARDWLAERLRAHQGALVFASHDRALIDAVATHLLRLGPAGFEKLRGSHGQADRLWQERQRAQQRAEAARRRRVAELEAMAEELRAHGHRGAQRRRLRAERELDGLRAAPEAPRQPATPGLRLGAAEGGGHLGQRQGGAPRPGEPIARFEHLSRGELLQDLQLSIAAGERLAIVGPNGSGKSTLLAMVEGLLASDDPRATRWWRPGASLLSMGQRDRGLADEQSPRTALEAWVATGRAEGILAGIGLPSALWDRPAALLSGGERARAGLALLMAREADVLLLDEPTNDLDLPAIEALEAALLQTKAAFLLVSHDARLVEAVGAEVVSIEDGRLLRWRGGLQGWRRGQRRLEEGLPALVLAGADAQEGAPGRQGQGSAAAEQGPAQAAQRSTHAGQEPAPPEQDEEARLAAEVAAAEEALADPRRWSERDLQRWRRRRRLAEEAIIGRWEGKAAETPPRPPFRTREEGQVLWGERLGEGLRVWLDGAAPGSAAFAELRVLTAAGDGPGAGRAGGETDGHGARRIGHLVLAEVTDQLLLPWAYRALVRGAARLAFYVCAVDLVQLADARDPGGFEALAPGWWLWRRQELERMEGWRRDRGQPVGRRRRRSGRRRGAAGRDRGRGGAREDEGPEDQG